MCHIKNPNPQWLGMPYEVVVKPVNLKQYTITRFGREEALKYAIDTAEKIYTPGLQSIETFSDYQENHSIIG